VSESISIWKRPWFWAPAAAAGCGALFALPTVFPQLYLLGWFTFVPFLLGLERCRSAKHAYGFGVLIGFLAFGFSTYWMAEFVHLFKDYSYTRSASLASLYWLYCAQSFGIVAVLTHFARRGNAVLWVFPTVLALVLAFFPALFPWQIGHAQSAFLVAIQATDIAGVNGLDFMLGLVSVLIAQALPGRHVFFRGSAWPAYALVAAWFVYGLVSLNRWDRTVAQWDTLKVGIVQADEPPSVGPPTPRSGFSLGYPIEMDLTEKLAAAGAEVVIWPELRDTRYYTQPHVQDAYKRQVSQLRSPLLFQTIEEETTNDGPHKFNTVVLLDAQGNESGRYRKIKRIGLAEYLPLFERSATAIGWARRYLGEFFGNFSAGSAPKRFDIGARAAITPLVCYEVLFPQFVADAARITRGELLTAQSNNGWFGRTRAPYSHMSASVLRSVENRRPLVHVMNNGLGGVVLPSGRVLLRTEHAEIAGYLVDVPFKQDAPVTFYSRYPYWLASVLGLGLALMLIRTWRARQRS
jgi:apolipoprotein N-acyltransferase